MQDIDGKGEPEVESFGDRCPAIDEGEKDEPIIPGNPDMAW
jgi:hypothetical protein